MALPRLISPLILLSLVLISSANPDYGSNTENPDTSNVSPFEHSEYYRGQFVHHHDLHAHVIHGYKAHGDGYFEKEGYTFPIPQENPEEPEVPQYGIEKKTYDYQLHEGLFPNIHAIAVEGLILCKSGSAYTPIRGGRAIIKCQSSYASGYSNGYYVTSSETNEKGCFVATLLMEELVKHSINLKKCKAYPEYSPKETCNVVAPNSESYLSPSRSHGDTSYYNAGSLVYTAEPPHSTADDLPQDKPSVPHY